MVDHGKNVTLWKDFFDIEHKLMRRTSVFPVFGDNDISEGEGIATRFFPHLKKGYYRFEWAGIQFFALNAWDSRGKQPQSELTKESEQMQWFQSELELPEVKNAPFRVVFVHDPVYISRGRSAEILKKDWAPIFEANNIDIVFASWHLYERSHHNGVAYIISGGAGAELIWMPPDQGYPSQADAHSHHYCRVDVNPNFMTVRAIGTDGTVLDELTLTPKATGVDEKADLGHIAGRIQKEIFIPGNEGARELPLTLFSYDCPYCRRLLGRILPSLAEKHGVSFKVSYIDLSMPDSYPLFLAAGQAFGNQKSDLPAIFIGKTVIGGEAQIKESLEVEIGKFKKNPDKYLADSISVFESEINIADAKEKAFHSLTAGLVLIAGLLDGLNPCAFATIIMLISYLTLMGINQRIIIWTGITFTLGVFLTYLLIGLVFFHSLRHILTDTSLSLIVNVTLLALVFVLIILTITDTVKVLRAFKAQGT